MSEVASPRAGTQPAEASRPSSWKLGLLTVALAAAIVSPLVRERGWDSFPLSSYPMFSRGNLGTVNELAQALLVGPDGTRKPASPALIGTPEPMIAMAIVRAHVDRGTASELCAAVAARARDQTDASAIEIAKSVFDTRRYFSAEPDARAPLARTVVARCEVRR